MERRIFWLGMHRVLKRTELQQLRQLGYEVFNPAYISPVYDQSADRRIDYDQPTTLPKAVFAELMAHDFFYTKVPPHIAELLNAYFDVAIVTINIDWLLAFMEGFKGRVIYRIYGQPYSLSDEVLNRGRWLDLVERDGLSIVPFAAESVRNEQRWFLDLCPAIVPYQIPDDTFKLSGSWADQPHRKEIAVSLPNIENSYYREAYNNFNAMFPGSTFRIFGPQRSIPPDRRIVGGLERSEYLRRMAGTSGYLYPYSDWVCYLPPIEMMELGGPVLHGPGSLLSAFYDKASPGLFSSKASADKKIALLMRGDAGFIGEILAAQDSVRARYDRKIVQPIFDEVFTRLLGPAPEPRRLVQYQDGVVSVVGAVSAPAPTRWIAVMLHIDGLLGFSKGQAHAFEGIPRVVDVIIDTLVDFSDIGIIVTCTLSALAACHDFFRDSIKRGRVVLRVVSLGDHPEGLQAKLERLWLIEDLNANAALLGVLVPHYYLFPEALLLSGPMFLYLPDYFPYLMPGTVFDVSAEKDAENKQVGVAIAAKSTAILTNSDYTRNYLTDAGFVPADSLDKVIVAPLPLLGGGRHDTLTETEIAEAEAKIAGRRFLFYPTANRPNKQISFLLRVFAATRLLHPDLALVLTCDLSSVPGVADYADQAELRSHIVFFPRVGEDVLAWLYANASALCLTTTIEGNFPPQVQEALAFNTPVVATRLPMITEILGDQEDSLLLCTPLAMDEFCSKLHLALSQPEQVRTRQQRAWRYLQERCSREKFYLQLEVLLSRLPHHLKKAA